MPPVHTYTVDLEWTGAGDAGTASYTSYRRDHELSAPGKAVLAGSSDPAFRGDPSRWSPEDLLVGALAQCHMLWFLHLAAQRGVVVVGYADQPTGTMRVEAAGHGQFTQVVLRPRVRVLAGATLPDGAPVTDAVLAELHVAAHQHCFIARSVNFPVRHEPAPLSHGAPAA